MHSPARPLLAFLLLTLAHALPAAAQTASPAEAPAGRLVDPVVQPSRSNQTIERIRTEDAGTRIDELRVGGQTQRISVQPKNDMPAYEIRPADVQGGANAGQRMWNFKQF